VQVIFHQELTGSMSPAKQRAQAPAAHHEHSSSFAPRKNAATPAPQRPPDAAAASGRTEEHSRRLRQTPQSRTLPPQHVLEMAWRQKTLAAEGWAPAASDYAIEQLLLMMYRCGDASWCWRQDVARQAADESADACAVAESCDIAAGDQRIGRGSQRTSAGAEHVTEDQKWHIHEEQLVQCEPDSSADGGDFCTIGGDETFHDIDELEGLSMYGVAFLLLVFALLIISYVFRKVGPMM
jgi:hypothetical protein